MQDTIVAYYASREKQSAAWKMHAGFGYEHVPSMLIEKDGLVFFGTKSGVVYCIDPVTQKILWAHKIDNSMVNTVRVLNKQTVVATTMDGRLVCIGNLSGLKFRLVLIFLENRRYFFYPVFCSFLFKQTVYK